VAQENDTKVVVVNTPIADNNVGASRILSNNTAGGRIAADNLGQVLGGTGSVALVSAPDDTAAAAARIQGFRQEMATRYPGIIVLAVQDDTADSIADATGIVAGDIKAHSDMAGVLTLTDNTTQGAVAAIQQAHKKGIIKLATFDASPLQMTGLLTGTIQLTVAQEPVIEGADAVDQAVNAIAGKKVSPRIATPMIAITPRNMRQASIKPYIYDGTCVSSLRGYMTASG
jgi:ABC-type sugar transport system substrate-binding protein